MRRRDRTLLHSVAGALALIGAASLGGTSFAQEAKPASSLVISLSDAIHRAQQNEPMFANALAVQKTTAIDRYLARAALLPSVTYDNQMLYTQPNGKFIQGVQGGTEPAPIFIANNSIHEYISQASINETIGLKHFADSQAAAANAARASAELEIARRGLISSVVTLYYSVSASATKQHLLAEALREAESFTDLTQKREAAREGAHADVVKAQLQQQQRQRDLSDATLAAEKARLELAVLLFPDPRTPYATEGAGAPPLLPTHDEVERLTAIHNPEVRSALAELQAGNAEVRSAKAAYLPDLAMNFSYGIDSPQFAKRGPADVQNLGYSISGTINIPVWDWFSTQKRIKQTEIRRDAAKITLAAAQRKLVATLDEAYAEATAAQRQTDLLELSLHTAEESLRLTKLRYSAGEATALEIVDAQGAYLSAETARADGAVRYQTALAELQLLSGTL